MTSPSKRAAGPSLHTKSVIGCCTERAGVRMHGRDMLRYEEDNPEAEANWFAAEL